MKLSDLLSMAPKQGREEPAWDALRHAVAPRFVEFSGKYYPEAGIENIMALWQAAEAACNALTPLPGYQNAPEGEQQALFFGTLFGELFKNFIRDPVPGTMPPPEDRERMADALRLFLRRVLGASAVREDVLMRESIIQYLLYSGTDDRPDCIRESAFACPHFTAKGLVLAGLARAAAAGEGREAAAMQVFDVIGDKPPEKSRPAGLVLCGLPSPAKKRFQPPLGTVRIRPADIAAEFGYTGRKGRQEAEKIALARLRRALEEGKPAAYDAPLLTRKERRRVMDAFTQAGIAPVLVWFEDPYRQVQRTLRQGKEGIEPSRLPELFDRTEPPDGTEGATFTFVSPAGEKREKAES